MVEAPVKVQVAGRAVLLIPHRGEDPDEMALPGDYRQILAIVRAADGPVQVRSCCLSERVRFRWSCVTSSTNQSPSHAA